MTTRAGDRDDGPRRPRRPRWWRERTNVSSDANVCGGRWTGSAWKSSHSVWFARAIVDSFSPSVVDSVPRSSIRSR